jgi:putative peptidoglycan lipid II flippase
MDPLGGGLLMTMLPYAPLVCLTALLGAMLQSHHRFGPTAAAPILLNLLLVAASISAAWLDPAGDGMGIRLAAAAVLLAGVLQVGWSLLVLRRVAPLRPGRPSAEASKAARGVARTALPMILGLGVLQVNGLVDGLIASWPTLVGPTILGTPYPLAEGSMAQLSWAQRLYEFPLGVFGIAVATAIFPALSRLASEPAAFAETLRRGVRLVLFIGLPASAGLMLVAEPLAAVVLQGRAFTAENTAVTAWILLGYAPAVWAYSLNQVLVRAFYARRDAMTPVRVAVTLVALNLVLNLTLIWTPLGIAGLAWSTSICALVQAATLGVLLTRRLGATLFDAAVRRSLRRSFALTAAMAVAVGGTLALLPDGASWSEQALRLAACVAVGGVVVLAGATRLGMPELRWSLGRGEAGDPPSP